MDLEFEEFCVVDGSPNTVLPCPRQFSRVEKEKTNDTLSPKQGFSEINFRRYRSASCKRTQSRNVVVEGNEILKRGSVYHNSQEATVMKDLSDFGDRRKIELPQSSANALSFSILDSLCCSDEDSSPLERNRSSVMSLNSDSSTSVSKLCSSKEFGDGSYRPILESEVTLNSFLQISLGSEDRENQSAAYVERRQTEASKCSHDPAFDLRRDYSELRKRDTGFLVQKSLSSKQVIPYPHLQSQSNCSTPSTLTPHFSPTRKTLKPCPESKSQRSSLGSSNELTPHKKVGIGRNKRLQRSLLTDFSDTLEMTCDSQIVKEYGKPPMPCSPAHLHGQLKSKVKHGRPFFEFSIMSPEDKIIAKTWKVGNSLNWVYTFHSSQNKSRAKSNGWKIKESNKESSMVGQMQVSSLLPSELKFAGALENSMVTEFVLYDIKQARKDVSAQKNALPSLETLMGFRANSAGEICKLDKTSNLRNVNDQSGNVVNGGHSPWEAADLHPNLEIAAIVIQVPLEKRESLKEKRRNQKSDQSHIDFHDLRGIEQRTNCLTPTKVNVVTSFGNHSLPMVVSPGPSRLLDRWKSGGGCDCGGWDMGCPLVVFDNHNQCHEHHPTLDNHQQPWKLYIQGVKDKSPGLVMTVTNKGEYEVDFHAQLTSLQAFSICVAILHSTEGSEAVGQSRDEKLPQCDSLEALLDEDVKYIFESVTEEKKKGPTSFVLNPPFSPIGRV